MRSAPFSRTLCNGCRHVSHRLCRISEVCLNIKAQDLRVPATVRKAHLHTSPWCGPFSSVQNINASRGVDLRRTSEEGLATLALSRQLHVAWRDAAQRHPRVAFSSSHEQAAGCSTAHALRWTPRRRCAGVGTGFPWAVGARVPRTTVRGCAVGMKGVKPDEMARKAWTFETDNALLLRVLRCYSRCPGCASHAPTINERGVRGVGTRATERYPSFLGALLAASVAARRSS